MKTSFKKLRGLGRSRRSGDQKDPRNLRSLAQLDELARASQDMQDMRDCYDSFLSSAAATANSAYEFSESLRDLGACLLEKTALTDDEETGKVLLMLGKKQFELQKFVDSYRSHLSQTITNPSESLLNELQTVEEMKRQCDGKRDVYDYMLRQREKGRGRGGKGENFSMQQLQAAYDEYDQEATLFIFRLKSLKQGQSRSLLTQAARHHAAQLCFFKKALKSLEAIEPHVKSITEQQHIDYHFIGLEDYEGDDGDGYDDDDDTYDGELSFDYGQNDREQDVSTSRNSMELDKADLTFSQAETFEVAKENLSEAYRKSLPHRGSVSLSAPIFADNKSSSANKLNQMRQLSSRKFNTYVLPTPVDIKNSNSKRSSSPIPQTMKSTVNSHAENLWHSSPLEPKKYENLLEEKSSGSMAINSQSVLRESNNNAASPWVPPPLADGLLSSQLNRLAASDYKKIKRYAFSGPITSKPWTSGPIVVEHPQLYSGPLLKNPTAQLSSSPPNVSPKASQSASPTFVSSPKISELHELPRPPTSSVSKSSRPLSLVGHSAPLGSKGHLRPTSKSLVSNVASPLPTPSQVVTRSFSIPSGGLRAIALNVSKPLEATDNSVIAEDIASPPLTPISLYSVQPSTGSETVNQAVQIRGAD